MKLQTRLSSLLAAGAACAALVAGATSAQAATLVSIGLQEAGVNGGAITNEASGTTVATFSGSYGTFGTVTANGVLTPKPFSLLGNTINVSALGTGTLDVWITAQNLTSASAASEFLSSLTTNSLSSGWNVVEATYYDPANGLFTHADQLAAHAFSSIGTFATTSANFSLSNPYSVTELYIIKAHGSGSANSTINVSGVPEPTTWAMMLFGVGMIGAGLRIGREKKTQDAALA